MLVWFLLHNFSVLREQENQASIFFPRNLYHCDAFLKFIKTSSVPPASGGVRSPWRENPLRRQNPEKAEPHKMADCPPSKGDLSRLPFSLQRQTSPPKADPSVPKLH